MNHAIDKLMVPVDKKIRLGDIDPGDTHGLTKEDAKESTPPARMAPSAG